MTVWTAIVTSQVFTITLRILLSIGLGALIGLERQLRARSAGIRTNALVSLGSCRVRTFSWRLDERIIICPAPGNDGAWWTCIPPRRWPRPGWSSAWVIRPGSAWNAGRQRIPGMPAIWRNPSSRWRRGPRRSNRCRAAVVPEHGLVELYDFLGHGSVPLSNHGFSLSGD